MLNSVLYCILTILFLFAAGRTLVEYEFQKEEIEITTTDQGMSEAVVKIVFRRRVLYHITNTCMQVSQ